MSGTQGFRYIRCDVCNNPEKDFTLNLPWSRTAELLAEASKIGWTISPGIDGPHTCPDCSKAETSKNRGDLSYKDLEGNVNVERRSSFTK